MWVSRRVYGAGSSMGWVDLSVGEQKGRGSMGRVVLWGGWI